MSDTATTNSPRTLSLRDILRLHEAHTALLEGSFDIEYDEAGKPKKGKVTPFTFGTPGMVGRPAIKVRYGLIHNLSILQRHVDDYNKAINDEISAISGGTGVIQQTDPEYDAKVAKVNLATARLQSEEIEVTGLWPVSYADLNPEANPTIDLHVAKLGSLLVE